MTRWLTVLLLLVGCTSPTTAPTVTLATATATLTATSTVPAVSTATMAPIASDTPSVPTATVVVANSTATATVTLTAPTSTTGPVDVTATPQRPTVTSTPHNDAPPTPTATSGTASGSVSIQSGQCPAGYPVKANPDSMIYHVPGGQSYDTTVNPRVRCYATVQGAQAAGYRAALR